MSEERVAARTWSSEALRELRAAAQRFSRHEYHDKNERWKLIANEIGRGKRDCYTKYKELKSSQSQQRDGGETRASASASTSGSSSASTSARSTPTDASETASNTSSGASEKNSTSTRAERRVLRAKSSRKNVITQDENLISAGSLRSLGSRASDTINKQKLISGSARSLGACKPKNIMVDESKVSRDSFDGTIDEDDEIDSNGSVSSRRSVIVRPIRTDEVRDMLDVLLGQPKRSAGLGPSWRKQGFFFGESPQPRYGLVQLKGGPCGVLAVVQAFVLLELMYGIHTPCAEHWERPTASEQRAALTEALTTVIWQAADRSARVCTYDLSQERSALGEMSVHQVKARAQVRDLIAEHLDVFMLREGPGVLLLLFSVMMTRGDVSVDMDAGMQHGENALIGRHNYAGQELVNLLLFGRASSNVFNGTRNLGDEQEKVVLRGVDRTCEIGFLTLFEHYGYMRVGSRLKNPLFPIWVICSESHYSVLFADTPDCLQSAEPFDLFYFDQLGNQDEEYRLTVNPAPEVPVEHSTDSSRLVSPIDDCIRTRWPGATVDWNGSDPLL
ncbi:Ubiquitin carboxyl-terminal hydrolase MINDY-3 [Hondaea fermentalgiana]|uniref:Ubiquitin carboxyl-terminal hydrolase MINDY-3 n=1 Tax=Hondaea fermentalgiana TaxID=2315210 RepID=A0A2R5GQ81_9STRA|nr:Ubiquitin carboxyl-terminal hydrolase MINDY-3 [Hondaea fermentalgiana]|eukprot:GBG33036.1 Ubiquitin carboxyl-terminal hydrolase MINDY-3 [Hondaea fermentalgiana]